MPPRTPLITFPVPHTSPPQTPSLSASPYTLPPWPQHTPSDPLDRPLTPTANIVQIPPIPLHWTSEFPNVRSACVRATLKFIFMILCMVAFGHPTLMDRWQMTCLGSRAFERNRDVIVSRIKTITVVVRPSPLPAAPRHADACRAWRIRTQASLFLASIAALITTVPPAAGVLDYTKRGPYICLWASFGILLGGIVVASADVYALATSSPVWVLKVGAPSYLCCARG